MKNSKIILAFVFALSFLQKRNEKKSESEKRYYADKTYVSGDWSESGTQRQGRASQLYLWSLRDKEKMEHF